MLIINFSNLVFLCILLCIQISKSVPHRNKQQQFSGAIEAENRRISISEQTRGFDSLKKSTYDNDNNVNAIDIRSSNKNQRLTKSEFDRIWTETGTVPEKLSEVPLSILSMTVQGRNINVNDTLSTSKLDDFPDFSWDSEPGALYTFLLEDNDVNLPPGKLVHYLATNIPGNDFSKGDDVIDYVPSAPFDTTPEGDNIDPALGTRHRYIALVYKQNERVDIPKEQGHIGCTPDFLNRLGIQHDSLKQDYNLDGPISGTFYTASYEAGWAEYWMCVFSAATGQPIPFTIPGINDYAELGECSKCQKPVRYKNRWYHKKLPYIPTI